MPSSFDCLPYVSQMFAAKKTSHTIGPNNITWAPSQKWQPIEGPVLEALLQELQKMYWQGVKRELGDIILTMNKWQSPEYAAAILDDEEDDFIHGFDTFVDQVSEKSREFAQRYNEKVRKWKRGASVPYEEALTNMGRDIEASLESESLKADIRDTLEGMNVYVLITFTELNILQPAEDIRLSNDERGCSSRARDLLTLINLLNTDLLRNR
jgi:hypothetical protein